MLTKPNNQVLSALDRLRVSPEWVQFIRPHLEFELEETMNLLVSATDDRQIARAQGKARFIQDFVGAVDSAASVLERVRSQPEQSRQA